MENSGRLFGQIAAEAGVTANKAKLCIYLQGLSEQGRSLSYAASLLRRKPATIKALSREFMIDFSDYRPYARERDKGATVLPKTVINS